MSTLLGDIAQLVDGQLHGDGGIPIVGAAIIRDAQEGDITLADKSKFQHQLTVCLASAVIVPAGFEPTGLPFVTVDDIHDSFAKIVAFFRPPRRQQAFGVSAAAHVSGTAVVGSDTVVCPGATLGEDVRLGARCVVHSGVRLMDGVQLGDDVVVFPNAVLYENTRVGHRVIIHACAVIGSYGFGYQLIEGRHRISAQLGYVEIGDDVEIGAATTIDRGTYGPTSIGTGTKIDNQVQVAHNCRIGKHNVICALAGIAGSCTTGDYVVMAGQVGLRDHTKIGHRAVLAAKAGVINDIPDDATYVGIPATPEREQFVKLAALSKLPQMRKDFRDLQKQVAQQQRSQTKDAA